MKIKKKNAISLIMLVITIIVLSILAATVIITLSNTNIIKQASDTVKKNNKASEKEAINFALTNLYLKGKSKITAEDLQKSMDEQFGSGMVEVEDVGDGEYTIRMKNTSDNIYTLEADKTITDGKYDKWDGSSAEEPIIEGNIIKISKASELKWLSNQVNDGNLYEGYTIILVSNIDLGAREQNGTWVTTNNESKKWTSIGNTKANTLKAKFDGQNHIIKGIYMSGNVPYSGIFGNSSSIYNLTVKDGYMQVGDCSGGVTGALRSGEILNCHNINVKVIGNDKDGSIGGIVGQAYDSSSSTVISNCTNSGDVVDNSSSVGGIIGIAVNTIISKCSNAGSVTRISGENTSSNVGGIVGCIANYKGNDASVIEDCYNTGSISGVTTYTGGLVGLIQSEMEETDKVLIKNSYNSGSVKSSESTRIGGILGGIDFGTLNIVDSYNTGNVTGESGIGGIIGRVGNLNNKVTSVNISKSYNRGNITSLETTSLSVTGGIVGYLVGDSNLSIEDCYNTGSIQAKYNGVGGILGFTKEATVITNCYNTGNINGNDSIGGISGIGGIITSSYNTGNITGTGSKYGIGGILGTSNQGGKVINVSLCYNSGTITAPQGGGIIGYLGPEGQKSKASQCYNKGKLVTTSSTDVGGLIGDMGSDATITNSFFLNTVGINVGVGAIHAGGDLDAQNAGAKSTTVDLKTYSEFVTWIKSQN